MGISITTSELIDYYLQKYHPSHDEDTYKGLLSYRQLIEAAITNECLRTFIRDAPQYQKKEVNDYTSTDDVDLSNMIADTETLDNLFQQNKEFVLRDHSVQQYLDFQRHHKENFLSEIQSKGFKLKSQIDREQPKRRHLDY